MEVTRHNFNETLPKVKETIDKADFLVIDAEFTGLMHGREVNAFDSPSEYYTRLLKGSMDFLLVQFGLSAFYWNREHNYYMNETYNFYVYPKTRPGPERVFLCQNSSLEFLASQGFDFNKWIHDGIPYLSQPIESKLKERLSERHKLYANNKDVIIPIPDENKAQIEDICGRVKKFLSDTEPSVLEIDKCNPFVRKLVYQEIAARFQNDAFVETKIQDNNSRIMLVTRTVTGSDSKSKTELKMEREIEDIEDSIGFSKVARLISQSGKLLVGHNMILDILHTLNHFFEPLPNDYKEFKEFARCMFPKVLDTKYMSSLPPFKDKVNSSVLSHLLETLSSDPFALPTCKFQDGMGYTSDVKYHEAGYDAYITGLCFLSMYQHIALMRGENGAFDTNSTLLKPFLNKLFLAKTAYFDSPYINLHGRDPTPPRDHVFHLTFPKDWTRNDIVQLFSPFGTVYVIFLDDTSAFVSLMKKEQARAVFKSLKHSKIYTLISYAQHKNEEARALHYSQTHWSPSSKQTSTGVKRKLSDTELSPDATSAVSSSTGGGANINVLASTTPPESYAAAVKSNGENSHERKVKITSTTKAVDSRKRRTPSGTFRVDEVDETPPAKKLERDAPAELNKTSPENACKSSAMNNEVSVSSAIRIPSKVESRKVELLKASKSNEVNSQMNNVTVNFEPTGNCVSAFKESDNWD